MFDRTIDDFVYFQDFGKLITVNGREIDALDDTNDTEFKNSRQYRKVLRVRTREANDIDKDTEFTLEGFVFRVYNKNILNDGLFTQLEAEKKRDA